jgi:divalent metal cation (Fe/Co/Zn/Cd) transporter
MQRDQMARLWWCCCHAAVAMYVFFSAEGSLAMTALSHLVFFDVGSAAVCVAVDVLGNFEVWRRSTIRHPFGLQRAEVLAGFAMSVFLVFGGFDLISHNLKHFLETVSEHGSHQPHTDGATSASASTTHNHGDGNSHAHHHHHHGARYITPGTVDFASLAAVVSTLVSAYGLRNHGRIRRVMARVPLPLLPGSGLLANPFHFLTLLFSFLLLLLPLVSVPHFVWLDRLICATIAVSMFVFGARLAVTQGLMLLMSYNPKPALAPASSSSSKGDMAVGKPSINGAIISDPANKISKPSRPQTYTAHTVSSVLREIEAEPLIAKIEDAQFWQVHYGLAMANLKVRLASPRGEGSVVGDGCSTSSGINPGPGGPGGNGGDIDDGTLSQLRSRLARIVQNRLGEGYGRGGSLRWEVTVQTCKDS